MKRLKNWIVFLIGLITLWSAAALLVDNAIICPSPWAVMTQMAMQMRTPAFYQAVGITLGRTFAGLVISFVTAAAAAVISYCFAKMNEIISRVVVILQAIPNIAYIILLLFWTSRQATVILVIFFLLFPMIYRDLYEALQDIHERWKDVFALYPQPWSVRMKQAFFPMMKPAVSASLKSASSLAFKAGVMAEILASVPMGLGRLMQSARLDVNAAGVLAYVIWLLILVFILEGLIRMLLHFLFEGR